MASINEVVVSFPGGRRVDARLGEHVVHTDQPKDNGGDDSAPSPFNLFLASIGACAGIYVQGFCAKRGVPVEGIRLVEKPSFDAEGQLIGINLNIELPADFPEKYKEAVVRVAQECSVKKAIARQPVISVHASTSPGS